MTMEKDVVEGSINLGEHIISALFAAVGAMVMLIQKRSASKVSDIDQRLREVEIQHINENRARQLIADAVIPLKEGQEDIKQDVKEVLRVLLERRHNDRL